EEDFTLRIRGIRRELSQYMRMARSDGQHAVMNYDKLVVNGHSYTLEELQNKFHKEDDVQESNQETSDGVTVIIAAESIQNLGDSSEAQDIQSYKEVSQLLEKSNDSQPPISEKSPLVPPATREQRRQGGRFPTNRNRPVRGRGRGVRRTQEQAVHMNFEEESEDEESEQVVTTAAIHDQPQRASNNSNKSNKSRKGSSLRQWLSAEKATTRSESKNADRKKQA
ncbi:hypothetical protein LSTR_LSTR016443, partial [Laodelphax striatellus]